MKSMTGFAHCDLELGSAKGTLTLKSYNNRYLDLAISLPSRLAGLEQRIRDFLSAHITRGKVECSLRLRREQEMGTPTFNVEAASALTEQLRRLADACGISQEVPLQLVAGFPGIAEFGDSFDEESLWESLLPYLQKTWDEFEASRIREGNATQQNIEKEMQRFAGALALVEQHASTLESLIHEQITSRFRELLGDSYDQTRVLAEVAVQLVRLTINEELARLKAHMAAFAEMSCAPSCGKKLDFLCQEMNREVNTIGSKNVLVPVSLAVVEMKDALENIREQLRNVE